MDTFAVEVYNVETDSFIYQIDIFSTYEEAEKFAETVELEDGQVIYIREITEDGYYKL